MISPKVYFRDVRKVKPQTLKNYMTMLRKLNNDEEPETVNYLEDTTAVFEYIKKLSLSTQRTYIICVKSALQSVCGLDDAKDIYEEKLEELNFQYDEKMKLYQKTDKEDERMCSLEELKLVADYWMELLDEVIFNEKHHRKVWEIFILFMIGKKWSLVKIMFILTKKELYLLFYKNIRRAENITKRYIRRQHVYLLLLKNG